MNAKSIVIQFRLAQPFADALVHEAHTLSEQLGYEITPSSLVKSRLVKSMQKRAESTPQKKSLEDVYFGKVAK